MFAAGWVLSLVERGKAAWARLDPLLRAPLSVDDHGTLAQAPSGALALRRRVVRVSGRRRRAAPRRRGRSRSRTSTSRWRPARRSASSAPPAPASRRCCTCCCATTRRQTGAIRWGAHALPDYTLAALRAAHRVGAAGVVPVLGVDRRQHRARARRTRRATRSSGRRGWRTCTTTSGASRRATTRRSASAASRCPAGSASASRSRARCWPMRRCCCSTMRCRPWTPRPRRASSRTCATPAPGRTAIIVSHRLSAVADADLILVLQARARRRARHARASCVARDGWYAAQWRYQQLEASLEDA